MFCSNLASAMMAVKCVCVFVCMCVCVYVCLCVCVYVCVCAHHWALHDLFMKCDFSFPELSSLVALTHALKSSNIYRSTHTHTHTAFHLSWNCIIKSCSLSCACTVCVYVYGMGLFDGVTVIFMSEVYCFYDDGILTSL